MGSNTAENIWTKVEILNPEKRPTKILLDNILLQTNNTKLIVYFFI